MMVGRWVGGWAAVMDTSREVTAVSHSNFVLTLVAQGLLVGTFASKSHLCLKTAEASMLNPSPSPSRKVTRKSSSPAGEPASRTEAWTQACGGEEGVKTRAGLFGPGCSGFKLLPVEALLDIYPPSFFEGSHKLPRKAERPCSQLCPIMRPRNRKPHQRLHFPRTSLRLSLRAVSLDGSSRLWFIFEHHQVKTFRGASASLLLRCCMTSLMFM